MKAKGLAESQFVQFAMRFPNGGLHIGRIAKIKGGTLTVILAPYKMKGKHAGKRMRIRTEQIVGVIYRRKVVKWHA